MKYVNVYKIILTSLYLLAISIASAQEFNLNVQIDAQNIAQPNQTIFKTLETSMREFYNNTQWTDLEFEDEEKITGSVVFIVTSYDNDRFQGNFQVSLSRPIHGSSYTSPTFNYKDQDIAFEYVEYAPLFYNANQYENNLISLLSFYAYTMLGIDADTFAYKGGEPHHIEAQRIVSLAQASRIEGWRPADGLISRFRLNDDMLSDTYIEYREVMYNYHIKGLDTFKDDVKAGKTTLKKYILDLEKLHDRRPNSLLQRVFFDAKADEIRNVYSGGAPTDVRDLKNVLQKLAPNQSKKWRAIKV